MKFHLSKKTDWIFKLIFFILLILELIACYYSYFTVGEVEQLWYILILFLNIIPILLYFLRLKIVSLIIALIIAFLLIPNQVSLLIRWNELKTESSEIIEYIYRYEELNENFPENILEYKFKNKKLKEHFSYHRNDKADFVLHYYVGTEGTTYFYYGNLGKWEYYPD